MKEIHFQIDHSKTAGPWSKKSVRETRWIIWKRLPTHQVNSQGEQGKLKFMTTQNGKENEEGLQTESVHFRKEMIKGGRSDIEVTSKDKSNIWMNPNNNDV